ncbi:hypothetical protein D9611_011844 [Ephemerocybe angulata]|uniref:Ricin B lectin domain-containing protein n=1 Tax=Ephemerocybe angulata TaxID=980116 RepID=A0A8H5FCC9_9AGAR|nr:hypothetical protein D9611_011844 [Tulosesus angulatus]
MPVEAGPGEQLLESGRTYKFANVKTGSALTIHPTTLRDVQRAHKRPPSCTQWEGSSRNGFWTFKNNETGLYLGFDVCVPANNGRHVVATANAFTWAVISEDAKKGWKKLSVPYTNQYLDLDDHGGWANGITIQSYANHTNQCQKWVIDSDTTFEPFAIPRELYKLLNPTTKTVAHLEEPSNEASDTMKWEVLPSGGGTWFIRNHYNGLYMGIKGTIAEKGTQVVGTEEPFAWNIAPRYKDGRRKPNGALVYVPNTELALNIVAGSSSPGVKMQLWTNPNDWPQYWAFEKAFSTPAAQQPTIAVALPYPAETGVTSPGRSTRPALETLLAETETMKREVKALWEMMEPRQKELEEPKGGFEDDDDNMRTVSAVVPLRR